MPASLAPFAAKVHKHQIERPYSFGETIDYLVYVIRLEVLPDRIVEPIEQTLQVATSQLDIETAFINGHGSFGDLTEFMRIDLGV